MQKQSLAIRIAWGLSLVLFLAGGVGVAWSQEGVHDKRKPVLRARRPKFERSDWDGIFFQNLFLEALKGERPTQLAPVDDPLRVAETPGESGNDVGEQWSQLIDATSLEDEVKRLTIDLGNQVLNKRAYQSARLDARRNLIMLSMLFAVISEYEQDIRWKEEAVGLQNASATAAIQARKDDDTSFNSTQRFHQELSDIVRGGRRPSEAEAEIPEDWAQIVDRTTLMWRLDQSVQDRIKAPLASKESFERATDDVLREAALVAVIGRVLIENEMLDAEDEDYVDYGKQMIAAGLEMRFAVLETNYDSAIQALSSINQSCMDCHADWR